MSLDRAIASLFGERCFHRTHVLLQRANKALQRLNSGIQRSLHPTVQRRKLARPENGTKAQNQFAHDGITGTLLLESVHDLSLLYSQLGADLA
jgi:hypothetical protein